MTDKPVPSTPVDVAAESEACRQEFLTCIKRAKNNPIKQQKCLIKYMACLIKVSGKVQDSQIGTGDNWENEDSK